MPITNNQDSVALNTGNTKLSVGQRVWIEGETRVRLVSYVTGSAQRGWRALFKGIGSVPLGELRWHVVDATFNPEQASPAELEAAPSIGQERLETGTEPVLHSVSAPSPAAAEAPPDCGPVFDSYLAVHWSSLQKPKQGRDGVWWAELSAEGSLETHNPSTRLTAFEALRARLRTLSEAGARVLLCMDFALGFPRGFAAALGLEARPWLASWALFEARVQDEQAGRKWNNLYALAAELNLELERRGKERVFWGAPSRELSAGLGAERVASALEEQRLVDRLREASGLAWKLYGAPSHASKAILGIPYLHRLRFAPELADKTLVWPFETGAGLAECGKGNIVIAEAYAELPALRFEAEEVEQTAQGRKLLREEASLRGLVLALRQRDQEAALRGDFAGMAALPAAQLRAVLDEEGWILGLFC
ncbi:MAG: hypothetical protein RBU37_00420 [Myxococcota bacterium]|jgi:hypothetical protein|nr:hypothetical protein [Myxococcota bacterium]